MRFVVTGHNGQVVQSLIERGGAAGHVVVPAGRPELDLASGNAAAILSALERTTPDVIVSAAAYTGVDKAESERELAFAVNAAGAGHVAAAATALGVPLLHLSTDYVFSGEGTRAWNEDDPPGPMGVYGASKLAGERKVLAASPNSAVLRTAWVYSPFGANFVKTMLRLAESREEVGVVADQFGNPTSALAIADAVIRVAGNLATSDDPAMRGVFHMAGSGETSWAGLAEEIFALSAARGGPTARVRPISTADYPTAAARPANSRLDCSRLAAVHGLRLPDWRYSLTEVIDRLVAQRT
ncbi:dTDP-4-dehydrorhamnose reductase [Novosphingobium album (ex Hu et al. 2023)]|uniref:dTDP-4-dehydrorhamnose reductase n=1 Tax=Novosphingobium album (ex Hu et al. 2023) TaxID=2930093 RepID=A0ABT0B6W3_9SPHN|nr:dTDP-4-dehydrorhamnose reductase [Novosphingobium album (ex Hu et al. 2023)]MCJ2180615.1 dTDP-4-dehydrorhamnose reductase [Novosphingobium album (ex Hu et al. 2023)]